jgi:transposase-like protein
MDGSRGDVLAYMAFPREHWTQIASTNPLERLNGEIKRRSDVVGIFPNEPAVAPPTMLPISGGGRFWIGRALGRTMERGFAPAC